MQSRIPQSIFFKLTISVSMFKGDGKEVTYFKPNALILVVHLKYFSSLSVVFLCCLDDDLNFFPPLFWFQRKNLSLFLSISLLTFWGTSLLGARLYWMGNKPPSFSNSDNPAADSDSLLARTLTFFYLPTKNLWLLLCPDTLSFDWSMDAIPLLKTICDWRNLHTVAFYTGLLLLAYYGLKSPSVERECNGKFVTNGKQNANGHSCHSEVEYRNSEIKPSFPSKVENGIKNNVSQRTRLPSTENIVVLSLSLLIIPFVPATNLFFYVGFVIAERVLYIPSMGFCLLITVGARALYVKVQKRFLKSLIFYATATLIVFYGLKTAIRNGDWQNEEMLYRSGIKVNPAKGNILFYTFAWTVYFFCLFISLLLALKHTVLRKKRFFYSILIIFVFF